MNGLLGDVAMAARFVRGLPPYLRRPIIRADAEAVVGERLAARARHFVALAKHAIYAQASSPYRALLLAMGCAEADLEELVRVHGVEATLARLQRAGVFVTVDELKGRHPIRRGSTVIDVDARSFKNPLAMPSLWSATGGSRGTPLPVPLDLACVRDRAVNMNLALAARGGAQWRTAVWSLRGLVPVLWYAAGPARTAAWFTQTDLAQHGVGSRFKWSARLLTWESRLAGRPVPTPAYAPLDDPTAVLAWLAERLARDETPHLWGTPSAIVRLCGAAPAYGVDITGTQCTITGEPITAARLGVMQRAGVTALPDYGSVESGGTVAYGCMAGATPDDAHVFTDLNALIAVDHGPLPRGALLISSLLSTSPYILFNASLGDRATLTERDCGCPMQAIGWRTHLSNIRSFEKLTAGGVTFEDGVVVAVLEQVLPARFGGGPTDYQLLETVGENGHAALRLLVAPSVGDLDVGEVRDVFLDTLGSMGDIERDMAAQWRETGALAVSREPPRQTAAGKILHLVAAHGTDDAPC